MSLVEQHQITEQRQHPRIIALWRYLKSLQSVVSFMNTGAHPDDETSAMLAALGFRDGIAISYACANRGEGGQNDIGSELSKDLGVVRTAEMERAAEVLHMRLYWLSQSSDDSIFDFGFSKSGIETLGHWGHQRTLTRFVDIIRQEKPDIICPTFLDIPGQHGHHRAMTQLAHEAFEAAADKAFTLSSSAPWQVKKLYLPAWSGAGNAYDDDLPPPPATLTIDGSGEELPSGWTWAQIGQHSRAFHKTQGMGHWVGLIERNDWSLHLAKSVVDGPDSHITAGLPATLKALSGNSDSKEFSEFLHQATQQCASALTAWPEYAQVLDNAVAALRSVQQAQHSMPANCIDKCSHKLQLKVQQLSQVIRLSAGADVRAEASTDCVSQGETFSVSLETKGQGASARLVLPENWDADEQAVRVLPAAELSDDYPAFYDPSAAIAPAIELTVEHKQTLSITTHSIQNSPVVLPAFRVSASSDQYVLNLASSQRTLTVGLNEVHPIEAEVQIELPDGWIAKKNADGYSLCLPQAIDPGLYALPLRVADSQAHSVTLTNYSHIALRARSYPAVLSVRVIDVQLPAVKVAYIGGGNDNVAYWLRAMGFTVTELKDSMLNHQNLEQFDTVLVGLFAMRTRPALFSAMPIVHNWVRQGGHLLTLYHRPWDAWEPLTVPPKPLTIGKPSLRWRVTNEKAPVTHLLPDHALLNIPNKITAEDWNGWHKERGLYFAMQWDDAYQALLSMHDPDEQPLTGSLLSARVGHGRHTHTSLILHHQMEKLVPGAYRLMANLLSAADKAN